MQDAYVKYVDTARQRGCKIERRYANGIDYIFIHEKDGWISIMNVTGGIYKPVIQAKDSEHADNFIALREPLTVPVQFF